MKRLISIVVLLAVLCSAFLPAMAEEKQYDLGGRTVTIGSYRVLEPSENSYTYAEEMALIESIEKKYNCKLAFNSAGGDFHSWDATVKSMALSGEPIADVFCHVADYILPTWIYADLVEPIGKYLDTSDPIWNREVMDAFQYNGQDYMVSQGADAPGVLILFNKRICAEYGITDEYLYDLQANGEWTWDKLLEVAAKCTQDTNNDGKTDIWGFGAYGGAPVIAESFVYANGGTCVEVDEQLRYHYSLNTPEAIEAIEWCRALVNDSGVCFFDDWSWGAGEKLWNRGKIAFYQVFSWLVKDYVPNLEEDEFGILLVPKGPRAEDYVNAENVPDGWFIPKGVENPEAIAAILVDFLYPYEWREVYDPVESFENIVFDDRSLEALEMIDGRTVMAMGENATWFRDNVLWYDFGVMSNTPGRVFAETYEAPSQASFDELLVVFSDQMNDETAEEEP